MKITTEFIVRVKINEEITKEEYLNALEDSSLEERKKQFEQEVIGELKDTFDTENIKIHELNVGVEEG